MSDENNNENVQKDETTKKKKNGLMISVIVIIISAVIGAVGAVIYCFGFSRTEIDLSKYVSIEFEGYEGYATVDESDIVIDQKALKKELDDSKLAKKLVTKIENKLKLDNTENLKNGDEVKLKSENFTIKVEGLEETEEIDLFENLEFSTSGISPNLSLSVKNTSKDSFVKTVSYTMEDENGKTSSYSLYNLSNGDKITVTASYTDSNLKASGYSVKSDTYEYTIKDAPEYILKKDQITEEVHNSITEAMKKEANSRVSSSGYTAVSSVTDDEISYSDTFTPSELELVNMYLVAQKKSDSNDSTYNKIYGIFKTTISSSTGASYDYYITVYVNNVATDKDGLYNSTKYYYTASSVYGSSEYAKSSDDAYNYFIKEYEKDYDVITIK